MVNRKNKLREIKEKAECVLPIQPISQHSLIQTYLTISDKFREWRQKT